MNEFKNGLIIFAVGLIAGALICGGLIYAFSASARKIERDQERLEARTQQQHGIAERESEAQRGAESADIRARESTQRISELADTIHGGADSAFKHIDELEKINEQIQSRMLDFIGTDGGIGH